MIHKVMLGGNYNIRITAAWITGGENGCEKEGETMK